MNGRRSRQPLMPQVILGVAVIALGVIFLAGNLGWVDPGEVLSYWSVLVLIVGAIIFLQADNNSRRAFGGLLAFVGLWGTGVQFFHVYIRFWDWWPALLIFIGAMLVLRSRRAEQLVNRQAGAGESTMGVAPGEPPLREEVIAEFAFWSGKERRVVSSFKRGELTAVMGGVELDLRSASTIGGEATLDVFAFWGGIEIRVPPDWTVVNQVTAVLGGAEDKSVGSRDSRHRLVLRGMVIMGGVEILT